MAGFTDLKRTLLYLIPIIGLAACVTTQVNFRFALKKENYKEVDSAERLKTNETTITSTYFQMEGPAWENQNIAFRNYFDERNGMDIFGKKTKNMVLNSVGIHENYHEMQDWGMDILKVGNSLGAGAIGLIIGDSLFRIGPKAVGSFKKLKETKREVVFELSFKDCKLHGRTYHIQHIISIASNTHYYNNKVKIEGLQGDEILVSGIVAHLPNLTKIHKGHLHGAYTFGRQTMLDELLGMGITTDDVIYVNCTHSDHYKGDIENTHLIEMKLYPGAYTEWNFFAGWEYGSTAFKNEAFFKQILEAN